MTGKANSVHDFAEQIGKKLAAAELMGAEGDVEGSIKLMEEVSPSDGSYLLKQDSLGGGDFLWYIFRWRRFAKTRQRPNKITGTLCLLQATNNRSYVSAR